MQLIEAQVVRDTVVQNYGVAKHQTLHQTVPLKMSLLVAFTGDNVLARLINRATLSPRPQTTRLNADFW
jgi:hypothetical protein